MIEDFHTEEYWQLELLRIQLHEPEIDLQSWAANLWRASVEGVCEFLEPFGVLPVPDVCVEKSGHFKIGRPDGFASPLTFLAENAQAWEATSQEYAFQRERVARYRRLLNYLTLLLREEITVAQIRQSEALVVRIQEAA